MKYRLIASLVLDLIPIGLLSVSLVGWGFFWGFEFGTGLVRLRLRWFRFAHAIVKPLAAVMGAVFWRLEAVRARLQTGIANEEVKAFGKSNFPNGKPHFPPKGVEMNAPTDNTRSKEDER